jgi:predicted ABC-class ATPase
MLSQLGLIAFLADGSVLPRASGIDPRPLSVGNVVKFVSPTEYRVTVTLPNGGQVSGMGIPRGVTLIVGGGYHGKSTLLNAVELGIYNHIDGDGRSLCVTNPQAVKIRASDGRNIEKTDISPFINNLPLSKDTSAFSTQNASGSTSQAASISEALEVGGEVLLLDEDTSATNFMIRDHRMQQLVAKEKEPITPFLDKVRQLYDERGVSTVLVMGGSGDYFSVADHVIQMADYQAVDVTARAHEISRDSAVCRASEGGNEFGGIRPRVPLAKSFDPFRGKHRVRISARDLHEILFGGTTIDLLDVEQLVDTSQTHAIAHAIYYATQYMNGQRTLNEVVSRVLDDVRTKGLDVLLTYPVGNLAQFRALELAGAINRMRSLEVRETA